MLLLGVHLPVKTIVSIAAHNRVNPRKTMLHILIFLDNNLIVQCVFVIKGVIIECEAYYNEDSALHPEVI